MSLGRSRFALPGSRTLLIVGLASLALGALALLPAARSAASSRSQETALRVALFDLSASRARVEGVAGAHERYARRALLGFAERAQEQQQEVAAVVFAEEAQVLFGPGKPKDLVRRLEGRGDDAPLRPLAPGGRDAGSALDEALRIFERDLAAEGTGRAPGTLELFIRGWGGSGSAALFDGESPGPRLAQLRSAGVHVLDGDALAEAAGGGLPAPAADVSVRSLHLPERVSEGESLALRLELAFREARSGDPSEETVRVVVRRVQEGLPVQVIERDLLFEPDGRGAVHSESLSIATGPALRGRVEVSVSVRLVDQDGRVTRDSYPENDERRASTRVGDTLLCTVYAPESERVLFQSLEKEPGFELRFVAADAPDSRDRLPRSMEDCDVLCLSGVVLDERSEGGLPIREVVTFVENGGGLLVFSDWRTSAAWPAAISSEDPPFADSVWSLLPLSPAAEDREPRDLVFLVDGSGSMRGEPFERVRRALFSLTASAPMDDRMSLHFFTGALHPELMLAGRGPESVSGEASAREVRRERLRELLRARVPGGSTQILTSLEQFDDQRARDPFTRGREALVFMLTDGREFDPFKVSERSAELCRRFSKSKVRMLPVAVGENADLAFLEGLVPVGETLRRAQAFEGLEELFQREVIADRVLEGDVIVRQEARDAFPSASPAAGAAEILAQPAGAERRIAWRVRAEAREGAWTLLRAPLPASTGERSDPVFAMVERGRGLVAQAAFPASVSLLAGELQANGNTITAGIESQEIAALLRLLGRHAAGANRKPKLEFAGRELRLFDVPESWPAEIAGRVIERETGLLAEERELARLQFVMADVVPGVDPRMERIAEEFSFPSSTRDADSKNRRRIELEHPASGAPLAALAWPSAVVAAEFALPVPAELRLDLDELFSDPRAEAAKPAQAGKAVGDPIFSLLLLGCGLTSLVLWAFSSRPSLRPNSGSGPAPSLNSGVESVR